MKTYRNPLFIILIAIVIFGGIYMAGSYFLFGSVVHNRYCNSEFTNQFEQAVLNKDVNFCSNFSGDITYQKNPFNGESRFCYISQGKNINKVYSIRESDFKKSCLESMNSILNFKSI